MFPPTLAVATSSDTSGRLQPITKCPPLIQADRSGPGAAAVLWEVTNAGDAGLTAAALRGKLPSEWSKRFLLRAVKALVKEGQLSIKYIVRHTAVYRSAVSSKSLEFAPFNGENVLIYNKNIDSIEKNKGLGHFLPPAYAGPEVTGINKNGRVVRKKKSPPRLRMPADGNVNRVLTLSRLWDQAARNQSGNQQRGAWFRDFQPWKNPRQRYAWNAFVLMDERLREKVIFPREYLAAVMPYYYGLPRQQRSLYRVIGKFGFDVLWPEWQEKRRAEGNGGVQGEQRVQAAAALATQSAEDALRINLRDAYRECQERGPVQAPTLLWGAEVLWLMWVTEPATHPGIRHQFSMLTAEERPVWRQEWREIAGDRRRRAYLLGLRRQAAGTDAAVLVGEEAVEKEAAEIGCEYCKQQTHQCEGCGTLVPISAQDIFHVAYCKRCDFWWDEPCPIRVGVVTLREEVMRDECRAGLL